MRSRHSCLLLKKFFVLFSTVKTMHGRAGIVHTMHFHAVRNIRLIISAKKKQTKKLRLRAHKRGDNYNWIETKPGVSHDVGHGLSYGPPVVNSRNKIILKVTYMEIEPMNKNNMTKPGRVFRYTWSRSTTPSWMRKQEIGSVVANSHIFPCKYY